MKTRFGFLLIISLTLFAVTSCQEQEVARAEVTVLQEYTATQGQLLQTRPIVGAEVRFYGPDGSRQDLEAIEISETDGMVRFEYSYQALIPIEIKVQGALVAKSNVLLELGETTQKTIVVSE